MARLFMRASSAGGPCRLAAPPLAAAAAAAAGTGCWHSACGGGNQVSTAGDAAAAAAAAGGAGAGRRCRPFGGRLSALSAAEVEGAAPGAAVGCGVPPTTEEDAAAGSMATGAWAGTG